MKFFTMLIVILGGSLDLAADHFYKSNGSSAGRSHTSGNTTYYYNRNGSSAGKITK